MSASIIFHVGFFSGLPYLKTTQGIVFSRKLQKWKSGYQGPSVYYKNKEYVLNFQRVELLKNEA